MLILQNNAGAFQMMKTKKNILNATTALIVFGLFQNAVGLNLKTWASATNSNWSNAANWNPATIPVISDSVVFNSSGGGNCILDANITVGSINLASGYNGTFDASASSFTITITGDLIIALGPTFKSTSGNLNVGGNFSNNNSFVHDNGTVIMTATGPGMNINPGISNFYNLTFSGSGSWTASASNMTVLNNLTITNGTFTAPTGYLYVRGSWNAAGGIFMNNGGIVKLANNTGGNYTIDPGLSQFNSLQFDDTTTITRTIIGHRMVVKDLALNRNSVLNLGAGLIDSVWDDITFSSGGGSLDFGSSTLRLSYWAIPIDFSSIGSVVPNSGKLEFCSQSTQQFTPKNGAQFPEIVQNGGMTTVLNGHFDAAGLTCITGTFQLNTTHTGDNIGFIRGTGGTLNFNGDSINVSDSVNLLNVTSAMSGIGIMKFVNNSPANYVPPHYWPNPILIKSGTGTTTVRENNIKGQKLRIESGTFSLGAFAVGVNDSLDTLETAGGGMDFGNCTLSVRYSNVDLSPLATLTPGTGALKFTSTSLQSFWPSISHINPIIKHAGTGALKLMNMLIANGFEQPQGASQFDLNGNNISIVNNGDFIVNSYTGSNMISGLAGRTISVAGNVTVTGLPPSITVDLNTGSPWTLNAGGKILFDCVNFDHCNATGSPGVATHSANNGGNSNWTFVKQWMSGGTNNWGDSPNWSPTGVPTADDSVVFSNSWNCALSIPNVEIKAISFPGYTGNFSFLTDTLSIFGNADFSGCNSLSSGTGALKLIGTGNQKFTQAPASLFGTIIKDGAGLCTLTTAIKAFGLQVKSGTFKFGSSGVADSVLGEIDLNGGALNLGSKKVFCKSFVTTGGTFLTTSDTFTIAQNANFTGIPGFSPSNGTIVIKAMPSIKSILTSGSTTFNNLVLWTDGSDGYLDTISVASGILAVNGDLVFRRSKTTAVPGTSVWRFDANNTGVSVSGNVLTEEIPAAYSYSSNPSLFMGNNSWTFQKYAILPIGNGDAKSANLILSGAPGTVQNCLLGITNPMDSVGTFSHISNDTVRLLSSLPCQWFSQSAGSLDFNGFNLSVTHDLNITNGSDKSLLNLDNRSIDVGGNASFNGQPENLINLSPLSSWNINLHGGSLTASYAKIGNAYAYGTMGFATNSRRVSNTMGWNIPGLVLTWNGSTGNSFKNPSNWTPAYTPSDSDDVVYNTGSVKCVLDTNISVRNITFSPGYSGTFDFGSYNLSVTGNADFSNVGSITNTSGSLRFNHSYNGKWYFTPKTGAIFPNVFDSGVGGGGDTVVVLKNALNAGTLNKGYGTWSWGNFGAKHSVQSFVSTMSGAVDFGNCTLQVYDSLRIGMGMTRFSSGSAIELLKPTLNQWVDIPFNDSLPSIIHNAAGTVVLSKNIICKSFENTVGSLNLNGNNISTTGDFTINGGKIALADLSGRRIACGGNMGFFGKSGDSIVVNAGAASCTLAVTGTLQANFAKIGKSIVYGTKGYAANSANLGNDSNWQFIPNSLKLWKGNGLDNKWSNVANWIPPMLPTSSDSVVFDGTSGPGCYLDTTGFARTMVFANGFNGSFDFSSSTLNIYGNIDFTNCNHVYGGSGSLVFNGTIASVLIPPASGTLPDVIKAGGMSALTIVNNPLQAGNLSVLAGTVNLGNSQAHSIAGLSGSSGASIVFGNNSSLDVTGNADFGNLALLPGQSDTLSFSGVQKQLFFPPSGSTGLNVIVRNSDTLMVIGRGFALQRLILWAGVMDLGAGLSHVVNGLEVDGGSLAFNSATVTLPSGYADFSGAFHIAAQNGVLSFSSAIDTQSLLPPPSDTLPAINHFGAAPLRIFNNALQCKSLGQSGGILQLGGIDVMTSGDFSVTNGNWNTLSGLAGHTISVGGTAMVSGKAGSPLNLNPESQWRLNAGQSASILYSIVGKCDASGSKIWPSVSGCIDSGNNVKIDFAKPVSILTRPVDGSLRNSLPVITGTASDSGSGVAQVQVSLQRFPDNRFWNGTTWAGQTWLTATGTTLWQLNIGSATLSDGNYQVVAQAIDSASNLGAQAKAAFSIKTTSPPNPTIAIVNNGGFTNDSVVQLACSVTGADSMQFSLNGGQWSAWEKFAAIKANYLITFGGESMKRISVVYKDIAGNATIAKTDSIVYDITPPTKLMLTINDNNGYTGSPTPQVSIFAVGADSMQLGINTTSMNPWMAYATSIISPAINGNGDGPKIIFARFKDKAGNISTIVSDTTMYDSRLPAIVGITVLDSNGYINVPNPKIQISVVNADSIRIALPQDTAKAAWIRYSATESIDVSSGGIGIKQVWAQAKTVAGAVSPWVFDTTYFDSTPPQSPFAFNVTFANKTAIVASWQLLSNGSYDSVAVSTSQSSLPLSQGTGIWGKKIRMPATSDTLRNLPADGSTMFVSVFVRNVFGIWSLPISKAIVLNDTVPPVNNCRTILTSIGDSAISIALKPDTAQKDVKSIQITVLNPSGSAVTAPQIIPYKDTVMFVPSTKIVGMWHVLTMLTDMSGNVSTVKYDSVAIAEIKPLIPVTTIAKSQTQLVGAAAHYFLGTVSPKDSLVTFTVIVKSLNDSTIVKKMSQVGNQVDLFPLADGRYELTAYASSIIGRDSIGIKDTFTITGATTHVFAKNVDSTVVTWQMMAIPSKTFSVPSTSSLGSLYHWDESRQERDIYGYYHQVSETGQLQQGLGYWRKATDTMSMNIPRGNVLDSIVDINIYKGNYGWNQIASPFPYPVVWPLQGILWKWNETTKDFEEASNVLDPWQGYWVMADSSMVIQLTNKPAFSGGISAKRTMAKYVDTKNWQVRMAFSGKSNSDAQNAFGFNQTASNGYDANDAAKPPRMAEYRYLFFSHPEWKRGYTEFARDLRKTMAVVETYTVGIAPGNGKSSGDITFDGLDKISKDIQVYVADENGLVQIENGKPYPIPKSDSVLYKTMFVTTDKNFLKNFPKAFNFGVPYPNPTRRFANIKYTLPYHIGKNGVSPSEKYMVSIALYDCLGRQVRQLVYSPREPGNYLAWWDGKNNAGTYTATGMYFCRLTAGEFTSIKRLTVIR